MLGIAIVVGTRPEIIKMAPIIRALRRNDFSLIHTGQHYDYNLSLQFIRELGLPRPDVTFVLANNDPTLQMGEMIAKLHKALRKLQPAIVAVEGDTNSVLAGGISAIKSGINLAHVEAGLRSYDWRMPEEHNRIAVDHISDLLFAPSRHSRQNLLQEKVHGRIHVTGNTVIDAVIQNIPIAKRRSRLEMPRNDFALVTLHRAENVDDGRTLKNLVNALVKSHIQMIFPIHPRTVKRLKQFQLYDRVKHAKNIELMSPVGYFDFLALMQRCRFIVTDSGGIQEEATCPLIKKHVVLLRTSTERVEAVKAGFVSVAGTAEGSITNAIKCAMDSRVKLLNSSPFGDGNAGKRTAKVLLSYVR